MRRQALPAHGQQAARRSANRVRQTMLGFHLWSPGSSKQARWPVQPPRSLARQTVSFLICVAWRRAGCRRLPKMAWLGWSDGRDCSVHAGIEAHPSISLYSPHPCQGTSSTLGSQGGGGLEWLTEVEMCAKARPLPQMPIFQQRGSQGGSTVAPTDSCIDAREQRHDSGIFVWIRSWRRPRSHGRQLASARRHILGGFQTARLDKVAVGTEDGAPPQRVGDHTHSLARARTTRPHAHRGARAATLPPHGDLA